ncbi:reverse transcriptase domain-containing protein [Agrobacterium sp.]|uniref:reverse transcriptase domain-containing protein n=1 Tax=Agrobacterium sp. TaxID=361 RepID=UPI0040336519
MRNSIEIKKSNKKKSLLPRKTIVTTELAQASGPIRVLVKNKINVIEKIKLSVTRAIQEKRQIPIFKDIMPIVSSLEVLQLAYGNIKSNKGALTPGSTNNTADEFSIDRIRLIQKQLKEKTFFFTPVRRIRIPKPIKGLDWSDKETLITRGRPLGIPDFDSKIVQEAIRLILNAIYEPIFHSLQANFGFRPNQGVHNALHTIFKNTRSMNYAIEGDIKGAFDNLDHDILQKILSKRIQDKNFLDLIYHTCRAGIFDQLQKTYKDSLLGVPQGGIVSPLLWNIYMHEFDKFVLNDLSETIQTINRRQKRKALPTNKPYKKIAYQSDKYINLYKALTINPGKKLKDLDPETRSKALDALRKKKYFRKIMLKTPSLNVSKQLIRFHYVRYADDWIIFTNAKKTINIYLRNKISAFLKDYLKLQLSLEKTKITPLKKESAKFLGFSIRAYNNKSRKKTIINTGVLRRTTGHLLTIGIDKSRIMPRLEWKKFYIKGKPREVPSWSTLTDYDIIQKYNAIIRGLILYYAPIITNRSSINFLVYIMEYSCYKTLCQKHRTSIKKLINKYGFPISSMFRDKEVDTKREVTLLTNKTY